MRFSFIYILLGGENYEQNLFRVLFIFVLLDCFSIPRRSLSEIAWNPHTLSVPALSVFFSHNYHIQSGQ